MGRTTTSSSSRRSARRRLRTKPFRSQRWIPLVVLAIFAMAGQAAPAVGRPAVDAVGRGSETRQLVGMMPSSGVLKPQWWDLRWSTDGSTATAASITARPADLAAPDVVDAIGTLADLVFESLPQLTCKLDHGNANLYCLHRAEATTPVEDSCCGDSLLIIDKLTGAHRLLDVHTPIFDALKADGYSDTEAGSGFPTHTFDLSVIDGKLHAILLVRIFEEILTWGSKTDVMVAVSIEDGSYLPTAAGNAAFVFYRDIGTFSSDPSDWIYSIQFLLGNEDNVVEDQWHANGVQRFIDKNGTPLPAFTQLYTAQAVVMTDPWTSAANQILQRFGSTTAYATDGVTELSTMFFGLDPAEKPAFNGVHNIYYSLRQDGTESITIFVNSQGDELVSKVAEFELNLLPESEATPAVGVPLFPTNYTLAACDYLALSQGGARRLSNGLYLTSSGKSVTLAGMEVVDGGGQVARLSYQLEDESYLDPAAATWTDTGEYVLGFYDPFVFIDMPPASATEGVRRSRLRHRL